MYSPIIMIWIICTICMEISVLNSNIAVIRSSVLNSFNAEEDLKKNVLDILSLMCPESLYCEEDIPDVIAAAKHASGNGTDAISRTRQFLLEKFEDYSSCCIKCSCTPDCHEKGNCCQSGIFNRTYEQGQSSECVPTEMGFRIHGVRDVGSAVYMITTCHSTFSEQESKMKCETPNSDFPDEIIPVHSKSSERVYFNVYCALCNFVNDTEKWDVRFVLKGHIFLSATRIDSLSFYRSLMQGVFVSANRVSIMFSPRHPDRIRSLLDPCVPFIKVVDTCSPQYQHWPYNSTYNFLSVACHLFSSLYQQTRVYKNVFCLMCTVHQKDFCTGVDSRKPGSRFTGLIDFTNTVGGPDDTQAGHINNPCNCKEWYDKAQGFCRDVLCPFLESRINCVCTRTVTKISGIPLDIRIDVRIIEGHPNAMDPSKLKESFLRKTTSALSMYLDLSYFELRNLEGAYLCNSESDTFIYFIATIHNDAEYDMRDQVKTLYNRLVKHPIILVGQVRVQLSLGQYYESITSLSIDIFKDKTNATTCKKLNFSGLFKEYGLAASTFKALVYCKTVKISTIELELLANRSATFRSADEKHLSYIYDKEKSAMCFEEFVKFTSDISSGRHCQQTQILKLLVLTISLLSAT